MQGTAASPQLSAGRGGPHLQAWPRSGHMSPAATGRHTQARQVNETDMSPAATGRHTQARQVNETVGGGLKRHCQGSAGPALQIQCQGSAEPACRCPHSGIPPPRPRAETPPIQAPTHHPPTRPPTHPPTHLACQHAHVHEVVLHVAGLEVVAAHALPVLCSTEQQSTGRRAAEHRAAQQGAGAGSEDEGQGAWRQEGWVACCDIAVGRCCGWAGARGPTQQDQQQQQEGGRAGTPPPDCHKHTNRRARPTPHLRLPARRWRPSPCPCCQT